MPDLLLELFSEEIPARMQAKAADDLRRMVTDKLVAEGLVYEGAKAFATPRRLALTVHGIPARQPDLKEERKGPRVGGAEPAIQGFLKATGLSSISEAKIQSDKKGDFYIALIEKPGRPAIDVLAEIIPTVITSFPWPKSMRWGSAEQNKQESFLVTEGGDRIVTETGQLIVVDTWLRWVRPLHSIVATFGPETEEPDVVPFSVGGIRAGKVTHGHRFMAPSAISVRRFEDYDARLFEAKVVLDPERRKNTIMADGQGFAFAQGYELVEDQNLLDEVAGLVEWPVVLMGSFDEDFLSIPDEVIRATIRNNQKCFVVRSPATGKLVNKFVLTANIEATDGGKAIIAGNERVIRARLSDAKFFYETDLKTKLEDRLPKFDSIVFHEKLGTQGERIKRIERLAAEIAPFLWKQRKTFFDGKYLNSDDFRDEQEYLRKVIRAASLAKADLLTEVVGEFPEVQGLMGKYYALAQGEDASIAAASEEHYKPQGPTDRVPSNPVSVAVALADKIDMLASFWVIEEKPTGSKDPFALRRAALGVLRIVLSNGFRLRLFPLLLAHAAVVKVQIDGGPFGDLHYPTLMDLGPIEFVPFAEAKVIAQEVKQHGVPSGLHLGNLAPAVGDLLVFFAERLKVQLREQGARYDLVDAVFALGGQDDFLMVVHRIEALARFLDTNDGKNLLAGTKRASNILSIEEKKDKCTFDGAPNPLLYKLEEEQALAYEISRAKQATARAVAVEDFQGAMSHLARLRSPVDAFFDKVKVNDDDAKVRENRLKLLNEIRAATRAVADFSKIQD